jgi:hypothetical protein
MANLLGDVEIQTRFAQLDEIRMRVEKIETDTQQLWPRLALDEADSQQLQITTGELKWEHEKDMENFYLFQKSQSQFAEELSKLKLQINDSNSLPRKLEQRIELLEVLMGKVKKAFAGMKLAGGVLANDGQAQSSTMLRYQLVRTITISSSCFLNLTICVRMGRLRTKEIMQ